MDASMHKPEKSAIRTITFQPTPAVKELLAAWEQCGLNRTLLINAVLEGHGRETARKLLRVLRPGFDLPFNSPFGAAREDERLMVLA